MKAYELTYIISSAITSDQAENLKKEVEVLVQTNGGVILKSEKSVPQSLAYPIKKQSSGYFAVMEFQVEALKIKDIKATLEKNTNVLRNTLIIKKPIKIMKERRTRKPLMAESKVKSTSENTEVYKVKHKQEEVKVEDIDKKLDEILSE